ncbi:hypothetical protein SRO_0391 [Streptomyces rochei]|nr:hypothetical protein SRO_0391 [Streptomyces rochei]
MQGRIGGQFGEIGTTDRTRVARGQHPGRHIGQVHGPVATAGTALTIMGIPGGLVIRDGEEDGQRDVVVRRGLLKGVLATVGRCLMSHRLGGRRGGRNSCGSQHSCRQNP